MKEGREGERVDVFVHALSLVRYGTKLRGFVYGQQKKDATALFRFCGVLKDVLFENSL